VLLSMGGRCAWHDPLVPLFLLLAALAVLATIALVAAGLGGSMDEPAPDRSPSGELPLEAVDRAALEALRFSLVFRGYRMDEVDAVLDRMATELEARDRRIAELEGGVDPAEAPSAEGRHVADAPNEA
jgi:DivIVA domain-containing protein